MDKEKEQLKQELLEQIQEWRRQQEMLDDMIEEAYFRIDQLDDGKGVDAA